MIDTLRACLALILCFTTATSPLQAPAIGISFPDSKRSFAWELNRVAHGPMNTLVGPLQLRPDPAAMLIGGRVQPFEIAELGASHAETKAESPFYSGQTSTLLPDGRLLVLGGQNGTRAVATSFIKDPNTGVVTQLAQRMQHARYGHSATVLPDGTVLIFGGIGADGKVENIAELFDPASLTFASLSTLGINPRAFHTSTLLTDGRLLIAGGLSANGQIVGLLEVWNRKTTTGGPSGSEMIVARAGDTATLQADGSVFFWGGMDTNGSTLDYGEIYDPVSRSVRMQATPLTVDNSGSPFVEASIPQDNEQNVPLDTSIAVRFSRPLQVESVNVNTVTLSTSYTSVQAKVVPAEGGMLAFVTPLTNLMPGTTYTVSLSGATDRGDTPIADTTISFTTVGTSSGEAQPGVTEVGGTHSNPFDSPWRKLPPLHAPPGVTAIAGQALKLNGEPLRNVTFQIGNVSAWSDGTGRFLLEKIPSGHQVMWIDGHSANTSRAVYGSYEDGVDVKGGKTNVLNYTIWMTALDMAHAVTISSPTVGEMVITNPSLPGLELHLPAGTIIHDWYGKLVTRVSITPIPVAQPPFPLPAGVQVPIYFTIQPGGAYLQGYGQSGFAGARLFYPNSQHYQPGTIFNFWNYDADNKGWYVYGQGMVAADARQVIPNPGVVIYEFTGAMVGNPPAPPTGPPAGGGGGGGDPVDLQTGLFVYNKTDLYLPDVIPLQLSRAYRQMDPTSRGFGIGTTLNYDIFLTGDTWPYTYIDLILEDGRRIHFDRVSSGTGYTDAIYAHTTSPTGFYGAQIVYSNGWLITLKNGSQYQFPDCFLVNTSQACAPLRVTDRNRNSVTYARDPNSHNLTQVTSPNGRWIQFTYDSSSRVIQATDNIGRSVYYTYDTSGRLWTVKDANGGTTTYSYDSNNNMTTIQDARGIVYLTNYYDSNNRVSKQVLNDGSANGSIYLFNYVGGTSACVGTCPISGSNITETDVTDPRGYIRKVTFNSDGYLATDTAAFGQTEQQATTYNRQAGSGLILSETDASNRQTSYTYDAMGNMASVTVLAGTPNAATTSFTHQPTYNLATAIADPIGRTTSFVYDGSGNLLSVTDALGDTNTMSYNAVGQLVSETDPLGNTTRYTYNGGDLAGVTDSLGRSVSRITDGAGRLVSLVNPFNESIQIAYNPFDEITTISGPTGAQTGFAYDANGNLSSVTDANQHTTGYTYDNMDRVATRKDPLLAQDVYQYDGNGNLTQTTDRRGKVTTLNYDSLNRFVFAGFGTQPGPTYENTIGYTNDAGNRLTQTVDSTGGTIIRGFDGLDRLTSETTPQGSVSYTYDNAGRLQTKTVAGQPQVTYSFDSADRLTQITQGTSVVGIAYDAASRRTSLTLPNGVAIAYNFDSASQLTGLTYQNGATSLGNISYTHDLAGRISQVDGSYARTGLPAAVASATYDSSNRLSSWGSQSFSYDANGNLSGDGTSSYVWNARNEMSSISGAVNAAFQYDPFGRRSSKSISGVSTAFLYDGLNVVQELSGGTPTANLLTGGLDETFTRTDTASSNFLTDGMGSTVALTDSTGSVATQYTYEPFGATTSTGSPTANSFQYTGRENDGTGLYYVRARYYSPTSARFVSQDPIGFAGGSPNLYGYALDSPVVLSDPTGKSPAAAAGVALDLALGDTFGAEVAYGSMAGPWGALAALALAGGYYLSKNSGSPQVPDPQNGPQPSNPPTPGRKSAPAPNPPDKRCQELANEITQFRNNLAERAEEFAEDPGNLPLKKPATPDPIYEYRHREGEAHQFAGRQIGLRNRLIEYQTRGCTDPIPTDAWKWATAPPLIP